MEEKKEFAFSGITLNGFLMLFVSLLLTFGSIGIAIWAGIEELFADVASGKIRLPDDNAEAMLMTCLRNKCYNILRRKTIAQRVKQLARLDDTIDYQPPEDTDDKLEKISHFISSKLTPQTARIIRMHYQQKLKYREIATMLGISETAVYKHLAQGIRKLRMEFNNL